MGIYYATFLNQAFGSPARECADGALPEHPAAPMLVERLQRGRNARAARPVDHVGRTEAERLVRIARLERARHVGEPRSEEKRMHTLSRIGDRVRSEER